MAKCPECGGEMVSNLKRKVCETCGLSIWPDDYDTLWEKNREKRDLGENIKKKRQREYLEWYQGKEKT